MKSRGTLPPGSAVGPYRLGELLGRGGMAAVYRALDTRSGGSVALKLLLPGARGLALERFLREAEVASSLQHPGIVALLDSGEAAGFPYIAYEVVEGARELDQAWAELELGERLELLVEVADALAAAHAAGLIHRDVKSGNVLVDAEGRARLTDFGLVTGAELARLTRTGALAGTPVAMAPEQINKRWGSAGPPLDVWALGVLLYEALTGARPFDGTALELLVQIQHQEPAPPSSRAAGPLPAGADALCLRALAKAPDLRPADAGVFRDELLEVLSGVVRVRASLKRTLMVLVALACVLAALSSWLLWKRSSRPTPEPEVARGELAEASLTAAEWRERAARSLEAGRSEEGVEALSRALGLEPDQPELLFARGEAHHTLKQLALAGRDFARCVELQPTNALAYYRWVALRFELKGGWDEAPDLHRPAGQDSDTRFYRAITRSYAGKLALAKADYDALLAAEAKHEGALNNRANLRVRLGDLRGALRDQQRVLALVPERHSIRLNFAGTLLKLGRWTEALAACERVLRGSGPQAKAERTRALTLRAWAFRELRDFASAERDVSAALKAQPGDPLALNQRAMLFQAKREFKRALATYERVLEQRPKELTALHNRAQIFSQLGRLAEAERGFKQVLDLSPGDELGLAGLSTVYRKRGQLKKALALAESAVRSAPENADLHLALAAIRLDRREHALAWAAATRAMGLAPRSARARLLRGKVRGQERRWAEALAELNAALKLDPGLREAIQDRGLVSYRKGDTASAIADFTRAIKLRPTARTYVYRANAHLQARRQSRALADYGRALRLNPLEPDALNNRGFLNLERNQPRAARADLLLAVKQTPKEPLAWLNLADAHLRLGSFPECVAACLRSEALAPRSLEAPLLRARALEGLGRRAELATLLRSLLKRAPRDASTLARLAESFKRLGLWRLAAEAYGRLLPLVRRKRALHAKVQQARAEALARAKAALAGEREDR